MTWGKDGAASSAVRHDGVLTDEESEVQETKLLENPRHYPPLRAMNGRW
jgi:hypothetical protein